MSRLPLGRGVLVVAIGGALGALARWGVGLGWPTHGASSFPWPVFGINVVGSTLLALLPAVAFVRDHRWLPLFLGTGVLGGFTTMSTASEQTAFLLRSGFAGRALLYAGGTLVAALLAVHLADRLSSGPQREVVRELEGDE